jgi:hypothetical protein
VGVLEVVFSIIGALALLVGGGLAVWRLKMLLGWKRRPATVVSYLHQRAYRGSGFRRVTVRVATDDGAVDATDEGVWGSYSVNQALSVLLVPNSAPLCVVVPEFLRFWMLSLIFIPFGGAFLFVALVVVPGLDSGP